MENVGRSVYLCVDISSIHISKKNNYIFYSKRNEKKSFWLMCYILQKRIFLNRTLSFIFNQTYKNYELVFVYDDPDKTDLKFVKKNHNLKIKKLS